MRLLDRQVRLLDYLTSGSVIFGEDEDATLDPALQGIDPRLLRLEACFSHEKRMEKIIAVFPKTYRLLGAERAAIVQAFVNACPPTGTARIENARQFYGFLSSRWRLEPSQPPYLPDVAACEFAFATVRGAIGTPKAEPAGISQPRRHRIRRHPDMVLLRCAYNIRPVVEDDAQQIAVVKSDTPLAIAIPPGARYPAVFEVTPDVYDFLGALHDWTDRSELATAPQVDELICELVQLGLVEVRR